jgi:hypothetical protein
MFDEESAVGYKLTADGRARRSEERAGVEVASIEWTF